jgi:hypothetical protein
MIEQTNVKTPIINKRETIHSPPTITIMITATSPPKPYASASTAASKAQHTEHDSSRDDFGALSISTQPRQRSGYIQSQKRLTHQIP